MASLLKIIPVYAHLLNLPSSYNGLPKLFSIVFGTTNAPMIFNLAWFALQGASDLEPTDPVVQQDKFHGSGIAYEPCLFFIVTSPCWRST